MTRGEAIDRVRNKLPDRKMIDKLFYTTDLVDALIALGILKVETTGDPMRAQIVHFLSCYQAFTTADNFICVESATKLYDLLIINGFKITR